HCFRADQPTIRAGALRSHHGAVFVDFRESLRVQATADSWDVRCWVRRSLPARQPPSLWGDCSFSSSSPGQAERENTPLHPDDSPFVPSLRNAVGNIRSETFD